MEDQHTDQTILTELGLRLMQVRLRLNLTQAELADRAAVAKRTIERLESGQSVQTTNFVRILRALGLIANLDILAPAIGPGPIEQLKRPGKMRRRASSVKHPYSTQWTWGKGERP